MDDLRSSSPNATWAAHCARGELAYQVDGSTGEPVYFPRVAAPGTGAPLEWRVSSGLGTVHATTVVHNRNEPPHNVALIDLDEGFRMMSRVEDIDPMSVTIGMRVRVRFHAGGDGIGPYPVFIPAESAP
jgi:uncharacterized OB-fold protein